MANVRFIKRSANVGRKLAVSSAYPKLVNGNVAYAGAPALVEDAGFPMSNALFGERSVTTWNIPAAIANDGSDTLITFEVGATAKTIVAAGVLGMKMLNNSIFPSSVSLERLPGNTHSATGWLTENPDMAVVGGRDTGQVLIAPLSSRFWRFRFRNTNIGAGFSVSGFFLATSILDLGFLYSGASETIVTPKSVVEGYGRTPTITRTGLQSRRFALNYNNNDKATRDIFDSLNAETSPFVYLAPDGFVFECVPEGEEFSRSHIWAPPDRFAWTFNMRSLP